MEEKSEKALWDPTIFYVELLNRHQHIEEHLFFSSITDDDLRLMQKHGVRPDEILRYCHPGSEVPSGEMRYKLILYFKYHPDMDWGYMNALFLWDMPRENILKVIEKIQKDYMNLRVINTEKAEYDLRVNYRKLRDEIRNRYIDFKKSENKSFMLGTSFVDMF